MWLPQSVGEYGAGDASPCVARVGTPEGLLTWSRGLCRLGAGARVPRRLAYLATRALQHPPCVWWLVHVPSDCVIAASVN